MSKSIAAAEAMESHYGTPMNSWAVAVIVSCFFLSLILVSMKYTGRFSKIRWGLIGALTYPLYLLHQFFGFMIFNAAFVGVNTHLLFWGTTIGMIILAYLVHVYLERPLAARMKTGLSRLV